MICCSRGDCVAAICIPTMLMTRQTYYVNKCRNQIDNSKVVFRGKGNQLVVQEKQNNQVDAGKITIIFASNK